MSKKLLIIGLDGVSWNVLNPMIENGCMPFLKEFIKNGKSGILRSTEPPITPTAWTSFMTGLRPEEHGVWGFRNCYFVDGRLRYDLNSSLSVQSQNIWQILSTHNKKVCIINLPLTYPPFEINGIMVSGFPVPLGIKCNYTYPENFKKELLQKIPEYQIIDFGNWASISSYNIKKFVETMICISSQRAYLCSYLLNQRSWDLFMVHFQETDLIQHKYWHYLDNKHPNYSDNGFRKCKKYYSYLDNLLKDIISIAKKKGYAIIILSDHGFQRGEYQFRINNWLFLEKCLNLKGNFEDSFISFIKNIIKKIPLSLKLKLPIENDKFAFINKYLESIIDYDNSILYVETNSTNYARAHFIKENIKLREDVINKLHILKAPDGRKVLTKIVPIHGNNNIYNIILEEGIVAVGSVITRDPIFRKPIIGKTAQIGVHHKDGIIIIDNSLKIEKLPEEIHQVYHLLLKIYNIENIKEGNDISSYLLSKKDKEYIQESLKNLGYV